MGLVLFATAAPVTVALAAGAKWLPPGSVERLVDQPSAEDAKAAAPRGPIAAEDAPILEVPVAGAKRARSDPRRAVVGEGRLFKAAGEDEFDVAGLQWRSDARRSVTLRVRSTGASEIRVGLRLSSPDRSLRIRVASALAPAKAIEVNPGAVRAASETGILWTPPTEGDTQAIELSVPAGASVAPGQILVVGASHIDGAVAALSGMPKATGLGASLPCQIDVVCVDSLSMDAGVKAAFDAKVASTARMFITGDTGESWFCTGTLLNNTYGVPIFLTAYHCIGSASEASSLVTRWNFQATTCQGTTYTAGDALTGGAVYFNGSQDLDETLVGLRDAPPSYAVLSGWDAGAYYAAGTQMLGMHHPEGDLKKTSLGTITGLAGAFTVEGVSHAPNEFYTTQWQIGLVEPGSSGSGLFVQPQNQSFLALVGTLYSGPTNISCTASTTYTNTFSRLDLFYPSVQRFLDAGYSVNYTDLWWNPSEPGWGLNVQHQGDTLFATWFTYDLDGKGMWLVMSAGQKVSDGVYQGALYRTTGTPFNLINATTAFDTPLQQVGSATLTFSSANAGVFSYSVNGISGSKAIQRQVFGAADAACSFTLSTRGAATNYQDLWWNSTEPGWGINITQQSGVVFATWFTYDQDRRGMWLVMSNGTSVGPNQYQGTLYRATGVPFSQINGSTAANFPLPAVGTLTLTFTDGQNARMDYVVNGVAGSKQIRRQVFSAPTSVCQ